MDFRRARQVNMLIRWEFLGEFTPKSKNLLLLTLPPTSRPIFKGSSSDKPHSDPSKCPKYVKHLLTKIFRLVVREPGRAHKGDSGLLTTFRRPGITKETRHGMTRSKLDHTNSASHAKAVHSCSSEAALQQCRSSICIQQY